MYKAFVLTAIASFAAAQSANPEKTQFSYSIDPTHEQNIDIWYDSELAPKLNEYREAYYRHAYAFTESENGPLLETCDQGTKCREDLVKSVRTTLDEDWKKLIQSFRNDIHANMLRTSEVIEVSWDGMKKCEKDHPCCYYNEVDWQNILTQIRETEKLITQKQTQVKKIETEITKMITQCPDVNFDGFSIPDVSTMPVVEECQNQWEKLTDAQKQVVYDSYGTHDISHLSVPLGYDKQKKEHLLPVLCDTDNGPMPGYVGGDGLAHYEYYGEQTTKENFKVIRPSTCVLTDNKDEVEPFGFEENKFGTSTLWYVFSFTEFGEIPSKIIDDRDYTYYAYGGKMRNSYDYKYIMPL